MKIYFNHAQQIKLLTFYCKVIIKTHFKLNFHFLNYIILNLLSYLKILKDQNQQKLLLTFLLNDRIIYHLHNYITKLSNKEINT